ncbi:MAG: hypothetical protein J6575_07660 [Bifidobacterium sp.]|nr:hypothetical protein [Bifidobacterium sp.]
MRHAAGKKHNASGETKKQLKWLVAMVAAVATLLSGGGVIVSANPSGPSPSGNSSQSAAEHNNKVGTQGDPEYQFLNFSQSVYGVDSANPTALKPGDKFTYQFNLGCSETNCEDASLADRLPAALQGFAITDFTVSPSLQANVQWKEGGVAQPSMPAIVGAGTSFTLTPASNSFLAGQTKLAWSSAPTHRKDRKPAYLRLRLRRR